jgi:hypothetical protein
MKYVSEAQRRAIENGYRKELIELNPNLNEHSAIYFFTREDEDGIKFGYIGQARKCLSRVCSHMMGYQQHIDRSLKVHKLYSVDNPTGWKVNFIEYPVSQLDDMEEHWIIEYAKAGYQLLNVSRGKQGEGKRKLNEYKLPKGYYDGIYQGRKSLAKELKHIIDLHLNISLKEGKENNKVSQKALKKFNELLEVKEDG